MSISKNFLRQSEVILQTGVYKDIRGFGKLFQCSIKEFLGILNINF